MPVPPKMRPIELPPSYRSPSLLPHIGGDLHVDVEPGRGHKKSKTFVLAPAPPPKMKKRHPAQRAERSDSHLAPATATVQIRYPMPPSHAHQALLEYTESESGCIPVYEAQRICTQPYTLPRADLRAISMMSRSGGDERRSMSDSTMRERSPDRKVPRKRGQYATSALFLFWSLPR